MFPRTWQVSVEGRTMSVVAGTREAAETKAAQRVAQAKRARQAPRVPRPA